MKHVSKVIAAVLCIAMLVSSMPTMVFAAVDENIQAGTTIGTKGYYNIISRKDYVLVPGAATETELVINNATGTRRQVLHVIEVDPSNPDVSIVPGYYNIDKDITSIENQSAAKLTDMAAYYEAQLGYNIVGGMNTDLTYSSNAPRVLVYNGEDLRVGSATSSVLCVYKEADGTISCEVKAYNKATMDEEIASGRLLHAVGVSFAMVVKDGELVNKAEERTSAPAARSMVGVKADGTLVICMNDGRGANDSIGLCNYEEGEIMLALGCEWAANCDGGGSSTFLTKRVGEEDFTMRSVPCDGAERPTLHGIFVASNVAPTGILDVVNIESDYDYFAPKSVYKFGAEAIDTHGYAMEMPADVTWTLSDETFGTISNGAFVSNGTKGTVDVQIQSGGKIVGSKTITIADPEIFNLSATSTIIPYSTPDKVRTIGLPIVCKIGEANVYYDTNSVSVTLSNDKAGSLNGFMFTATEDTSISSVNILIQYIATGTKLTYTVEFGKGSEIIYDFEDGELSGFVGFDEAKKWSKDNGVNNTLVGNNPLAGQFSEQVDSETFVASTTNGGQVRNGEYALAWSLDNTDAGFGGWTYNVLFNIGETVVLRDVANGMKATALGMWLYIPEGAAGLAFQSQLYTKAASGGYTCWQAHFTFKTVGGTVKNLNSCTEADIPESRWVYASIDLTGYDYVCTPVASDGTNSRSPSFLRTYIKPMTPANLTFYIDDITLDYSSAVDDRILPTINGVTYATADTAVALENGTKINGNVMAFSAKVSDNTGLDSTTGKIYVDGVEVKSSVVGGNLSSEDVKLISGSHTVTFEIKDELGNQGRITRTFQVIGDAVIAIEGHNDSGAPAEYDSIYYVDIKSSEISTIEEMKFVLKLQNANKWELEGAVVANGFTATYDYNEISGLLSVSVKSSGNKGNIVTDTIVSIPVRVWSWDAIDHITGQPVSPESQFNTGYCPIVTIDCDVVYGNVKFFDDTTSPFGGAISVETMLNDTVNPWHYHDEVLSVFNKEATATEGGYENRTYCETCKSIIDWGTTFEPKGHNYKIVDGKFVCADEGCGDVYKLGTGIVEMNGQKYCAIAGKLVSGWQFIDDNNYYFDETTFAAKDGKVQIDDYTYEFENNILVAGQVVRQGDNLVYMWAGKVKAAGWFTIKDKTYLALPNRVLATGRTKFMPSTNSATYICDFDENGVLLDRHMNGVVTYNGDKYYVEDSIVQYGMREFEGNLYYFRSSGIAATGKYFVAADKTNGLAKSEYYVFGEDGKMIKNGWSTAWDGVERYIVNGKPSDEKGLITFDDEIYYINSNGTKAIGRCSVTVDELNNIMEEDGDYLFDEKGKLIKEGWSTAWDGIERHIVNGRPDTRQGLINIDGDMYYIRSTYTRAIGKYYVSGDKLNGILDEAGYYLFDEDGKFIREGWSTAWDGQERHIVNGRPDTRQGLIEINGDMYYIRSTYTRATGKYYVPADKLNGMLDEPGYYLFDEDGKFIKEGWSTAWDGIERHVINGKPDTRQGLIEINGDIYYIRSTYTKATGRYYVPADKLNGILGFAGYYMFDEDGKLILY